MGRVYEGEIYPVNVEKDFKFNDLLNSEHPEIILEKVAPFMELMMEYRCALMEVETKLKVLNEEFAAKNKRNPVETIKTRIKTPLSITEKLKRKGVDVTVENMEKYLADIAGIRVICSFQDDIYPVASMLSRQDYIVKKKKKDYIKHPKSNGYRSLHLILDVPIFLSNEKKHMKVEVQFRTIAMDFWASLDHKLKYKKNVKNPDVVAQELLRCADIITEMDQKMQDIRDMIEEGMIEEEKESLVQNL